MFRLILEQVQCTVDNAFNLQVLLLQESVTNLPSFECGRRRFFEMRVPVYCSVLRNILKVYGFETLKSYM